MRLTDVNQEDNGFYTCVVSNEFGQLNWTRKLHVLGRSCSFRCVFFFSRSKCCTHCGTQNRLLRSWDLNLLSSCRNFGLWLPELWFKVLNPETVSATNLAKFHVSSPPFPFHALLTCITITYVFLNLFAYFVWNVTNIEMVIFLLYFAFTEWSSYGVPDLVTGPQI